MFAGRQNPVHRTLLDQRPEGGRGKGGDNEALATHVPQPADARWALQGYLVECDIGARGFAPPLRLGGEDDETPPRIGSCKGWVLLWTKNLLRLEPDESTPITTHQQACMETTTPPTQLPAPVVLGDEGGPIVDDVIGPVE